MGARRQVASDSLRGGEIATTETLVHLDDKFSLAPNSAATIDLFPVDTGAAQAPLSCGRGS
jgi:hypothetical protein